MAKYFQTICLSLFSHFIGFLMFSKAFHWFFKALLMINEFSRKPNYVVDTGNSEHIKCSILILFSQTRKGFKDQGFFFAFC